MCGTRLHQGTMCLYFQVADDGTHARQFSYNEAIMYCFSPDLLFSYFHEAYIFHIVTPLLSLFFFFNLFPFFFQLQLLNLSSDLCRE